MSTNKQTVDIKSSPEQVFEQMMENVMAEIPIHSEFLSEFINEDAERIELITQHLSDILTFDCQDKRTCDCGASSTLLLKLYLKDDGCISVIMHFQLEDTQWQLWNMHWAYLTQYGNVVTNWIFKLDKDHCGN